MRFLAAATWLCFCLAIVFAPHSAHAGGPFDPIPTLPPIAISPVTGDVCPLVDNFGNPLVDIYGLPIPINSTLTRRIMPCIQNVILYAANTVLFGISNFMADTVAIACALALTLLGLMIMGGKAGAPMRDTFVLALKIGAVMMFSANFASFYFDPTGSYGGFFGLMLDTMNYLMAIVTNYVTDINMFASNATCTMPAVDLFNSAYRVWDTVDCMLEILIGGVFSTGSLMYGLVGFFIAAMVSNSMGFFIGLLGFYIIYQLIVAIIRCLYLVASCYIAFSIMVMVSPFFIPTILFRATRAYFAKWLRLSLSFIIQPMIVFAYLGMMAVAFDAVVYTGPQSLYGGLAGSNTNIPGFQMGAWLQAGGVWSCDLPHGIYCIGGLGSQAIQIEPKRVMENFGLPGSVNGGEMGPIGQVFPFLCGTVNNNDPAQGCSSAVYSALGIGSGLDPVTGSANTHFVRIGMPVTMVDWNQLAAANGFLSVTDYILNLFLLLVMAAVTSYIFSRLFDVIPFLSSGLAGNPFGTTLGGTNTGTVPQVIEKLSWNPAQAPAGFE